MLLLAIERQHRRLVLRLELQHVVGVEHDRVAEGKVGRDWDHRDRARAREDQRPADREAVRGAAGRGRHDEPVRPVHDERLAIDADRDIDRAHLLASRDDDVVQRERAHDLLPRTDQAGIEKRTLLDGEAPREHVAHRLVELIDRRGGEEPEPPQVDSEDRDVEGRKHAGRAQHGPVAAEDEGDVGALDLFRERAGVQRELHRLVAGPAQLLADRLRRVERRGPIWT